MSFLWYGLVELVLIIVVLFLFYGMGSLKKKATGSSNPAVEKKDEGKKAE